MKNGDRNASSNIQLANGDTVWVKYVITTQLVKPLAQAMNEAKAKVIDAKARKAAQAKIATMLTEFKTQPAEQVAKNKVAFESAGVFSRSQGFKSVKLNVQHLV